MFFFKISAKIENGFRFRSFSILAEILKKNVFRNDLNKKCSIEECAFQLGKIASVRPREWPSMAILHGPHGLPRPFSPSTVDPDCFLKGKKSKRIFVSLISQKMFFFKISAKTQNQSGRRHFSFWPKFLKKNFFEY